MVGCNKQMRPPDAMLLEALSGCLDSADRALLERRREQNSQLTFEEFWDELQGLYDRDSVTQQRQAWECVKISHGELTLEKWQDFQRQYELKRDRVEDRTAAEERKLLFQNLPSHLAKDVLKEETKRQRGKYLVRVSNLPDKPLHVLQTELSEYVQENIGRVTMTGAGLVVTCASPNIQKKILNLDGGLNDGKQIRVCRVENEMTSEEICEFITERLQTEEKLAGLQQTFKTPEKIREVAAIHNHGRGKGKGKGFVRNDKRENSPRSPAAGNPKPQTPPPSSHGKGKGKGGGKGSGGKGIGNGFCQSCHEKGLNARHSSGECRNWQKHDNGKCYACESQGKPFHHSFKECKIWQEWNQHKMSGKGGAKNAGSQQSPEQTGGGVRRTLSQRTV